MANSFRQYERNREAVPDETRIPLGGVLAVPAFALACLGFHWLGDNLFNIARCMADARAQDLPLVGNGDHDWAEIFGRWGVLHLDGRIAGKTRGMGSF